MKIGIIGAGNVGGTLGRLWAQQGHEIIYGARNPESEKVRAALAAAGPQAHVASLAEAVASAEVVVIAVPYSALADTVPALGNLAGKVVIDAVNNVGAAADAPPIAMEIAGLLPGARVVKAFNTMGFDIMADPRFGDMRADNFICGDDAEAKAVATQLAQAIGFEVVDVGPLSSAGLVEGLARLWIDLAFRRGFGRQIAFKLLKR